MSSTEPVSLPTIVLLHSLGASGDEFLHVIDKLPSELQTLAVDLPGFGSQSTAPGTSVNDMVRFVTNRMREAGIARALLVGHSMGGKIASLIAARAQRNDMPFLDITGVVLLAASPPSPEPMTDSKRDEMLSWVAEGQISEAHAKEFVDANLGGPLPERQYVAAAHDVRRADPDAWSAWLTTGSREDRSADVGEITAPAVIVSGGSDGDLGADAQRRLNGHHYPAAEFVTLEGAAHLLPLERPAEVAAIIAALAARA